MKISFHYSTYSIIALLLLTQTALANVQAGDLLISEVLANPSAVTDSNGEWFELFNASDMQIDISGLTLRDDGSNSHIISNGSTLLIAPGSYFVLGANNDATSNGGYNPDYVYSGFSLTNSSDQIVIEDGINEILRLDYSGSPFGIAGVSAELIIQTNQPNQSNYAATMNTPPFQFGQGDFGTPGAQGSIALRSASPVPIPASIWLLCSALLLLLRNSRSTVATVWAKSTTSC